MLGQYIYLKQTKNNNPGYRPSAPKPASTKSGFDRLLSQVSNPVEWAESLLCLACGNVWRAQPRTTTDPLHPALSPEIYVPEASPYPAGSQEVQGRQKVTAMIPLVYLLPLRGKAHTEG